MFETIDFAAENGVAQRERGAPFGDGRARVNGSELRAANGHLIDD